MSEELRLNNLLGRTRGTDVSEMNKLTSWIKAQLRLGNAFTVEVDKYGHAKLKKK